MNKQLIATLIALKKGLSSIIECTAFIDFKCNRVVTCRNCLFIENPNEYYSTVLLLSFAEPMYATRNSATTGDNVLQASSQRLNQKGDD